MRPGALLFVAAIALLACACQRTAHGAGDDAAPDIDHPPQRPEFLALAEALEQGDNPYHGRAPIARLRARLEDPATRGSERIDLRLQLAGKLLEQGDEEGAVALYEEARKAARRVGDLGRERTALARLAVAWLRVAEVRNCVERHNAECCIFPLRGGALHQDRDPAIKARDTLLSYLRAVPEDIGAVWLLNIAAMALDEWPDGLAQAHRLPPETFTSAGTLGRFRDVAPDLGLDVESLCGGTVVEDFDGDGLLDILVSTYDPRGPLALFRNTGRGGFEDVSEASRVSDQLAGFNLVPADYDGDGDRDVLVLRGAWLYDDGQIRNSLLRNDGGVLVDVTRELGLAEPARPTQTALWGDLDADGDLDLFIGNESRAADHPAGDYPCQLFRNDGERFVDVAGSSGVTNDRYTKGVAAGDYDDDGDLDLYASNVGPNRLYRNDGGLRFTDVAAAAGVTEPSERSFATWFFDYDNDGRLDLFVAGFQATVRDLAAEALGRPHQAVLPRLYRNRGDGTLEDVTAAVDLDHVYLPMGANFGDLDHDGWLDVYLTTGDPGFETLMPNKMLRNDAGRRFLDVTTAGGFGHLQKGHGVAFADIDHDGDQDVYHQLGGFYPSDRFPNALFLNPGSGHRFLYVELVGTTSNRDAVGARLTIVVRTASGSRSIHRAVGSVSSFGGSPRRQEIGLGDALAVERLEVVWPATGERQVFRDVALDGMIRVIEGRPEPERLPLEPIPLDVD